MAMDYRLDISVNRASQDVYNFIASQRQIEDMMFDASYPQDLALQYVIPNTAWKTGNRILIKVLEEGGGTSTVRILSSNNKATQVIDGGKNKKNCDTIAQYLINAFNAADIQGRTGMPPVELRILPQQGGKAKKGCMTAFLIVAVLLVILFIIVKNA